MLRLLRYLWTGDGHAHVWEVITKAEVLSPSGLTRRSTMYDLQCKVCGNIKTKECKPEACWS